MLFRSRLTARPNHNLYTYKPNSVSCILLQVDGHLSGPTITRWLKRRSHNKVGTALHRGKNFVVAPSRLRKIIPEGTLAFRHRRHCSHLLDCSRRALPATLLYPQKWTLCSDFPPVVKNDQRLSNTKAKILYNKCLNKAN